MLPPQPVSSLHAHDAYYGANPPGSKALIAELERSGLRGRGGAGFPTATKLAAVARGRKTVVVVNATEGEPASRKDAVLSSLAPHLILDGAVLAAGAVGAAEVHVCVERRGEGANAVMMRAVEERALAKRDQVEVRLH
jgi:NADH:ubiquinone oxidoreductase subunit F (NADH-binding)